MCNVTKIISASFLLLCVCVCVQTEKHRQTKSKMETNTPKKSFGDFIKKQSLLHHFKKIVDQKKAGDTRRKYGKTIMQIIDRTDELLQFDIDKLEDSNNVLNASRRYFRPPGRILDSYQRDGDAWSLRPRIYELMKQTMYSARDAMTVITDLRAEYSWHSLYKMGFLFSKADDQAKLFQQLSQKYQHYARIAREYDRDELINKMHPVSSQEIIERMLNHWFEYDLLIDIIKVNDSLCRKTLRYMKKLDDLDNWFTDTFDDVYYIYKVAAEDNRKRQLEKQKKKQREKLQQRMREHRQKG